MKIRSRFVFFFVVSLSLGDFALAAAPAPDFSKLLHWRNIGPIAVGGCARSRACRRSATIDGVLRASQFFDGAGTQAAAEFAKEDHKYHELFAKVRGQIVGACSYCAGAFKVTEKIEAAQIPLLDEFKGHPSFKKMIDAGYQVLVF